MILVRDVLQLKFGKAKDVKALAKEGAALETKLGMSPSRMMMDLTGPFYTFVVEATFPSLSDYEKSMKDVFAAKEWGEWYQKLVPLVESGRREIYTIME